MSHPRALAAPAPRVVTLPTCPRCDEVLRLERVGGNHDRPALSWLWCRCGYRERCEVERQAVPA